MAASTLFCSCAAWRIGAGSNILAEENSLRTRLLPHGNKCASGTRDSIFGKTTGQRSSAIVSTSGGASRVVRHTRRAVPSSGELSEVASGSGTEGDSSLERTKLKEKLLAAIDLAEGNLNEECLAIVAELGKANPNVGVLEKDPELWTGFWQTIRATFKGTGKQGERDAEVGYRGAPLTLGRLTFNIFKPAELNVFMQDSYNQLAESAEGGYDYLLFITFDFENPRGADLPKVEGVVTNRGKCTILGPSRQEVVFLSAELRPRYPERDLEVWKETLAENVEMGENGVVVRPLPNPKNFLDYIYIDDELRITRGGMGAHVVVKKLRETSPEFMFSLTPS